MKERKLGDRYRILDRAETFIPSPQAIRRRLLETQRRIFEMKDAGMTRAEIAEVLSTSASQVRKMLGATY